MRPLNLDEDYLWECVLCGKEHRIWSPPPAPRCPQHPNRTMELVEEDQR